MTSKERMNVVLRGGKPDRIPMAIMQEETYLCRATGADIREMTHGDSNARADIQKRLMKRHPYNDVLISWPGTTRQPTHRLKRAGSRYYWVDLAKGTQVEVADSTEGELPDGPATSERSVANPIQSIDEIDARLPAILSPSEANESGRSKGPT